MMLKWCVNASWVLKGLIYNYGRKVMASIMLQLSLLQLYFKRVLNSRGATALLINRTSGKGLIVHSTSANGPLFRNPFLTSTGWCEKYFLYVFHFSRPKKGVNLLLLFLNKYFDFFSLSLITIYPNWPTNIINTIKEVLVSTKPKFRDKLFNFDEKNANFTFFRKN